MASRFFLFPFVINYTFSFWSNYRMQGHFGPPILHVSMFNSKYTVKESPILVEGRTGGSLARFTITNGKIANQGSDRGHQNFIFPNHEVLFLITCSYARKSLENSKIVRLSKGSILQITYQYLNHF